MSGLVVPAATAARGELADWLELEAVRAADRNSSVQDLVSALRRSGSPEEVEDERLVEGPDDAVADRGGETSEPIAQAAFAEIEDRDIACNGAYPFRRGSDSIQGRRGVRGSLYLFLLLLSKFGKDAGPDGLNVPQLFEEISEVAIGNSMGGERNSVETCQFGFPRRIAPAGFKDAVDELCRRTGEGTGSKDRPKRKDQKDAALDIVAWRPFPDGRRGLMMAWGQCATGADWKSKLTDLNPANWAEAWMMDRPAAVPLPAFFAPHRLEADDWDLSAIHAGVLFDRCRIAALARPLKRRLHDGCRAYNKHVLSEELGV